VVDCVVLVVDRVVSVLGGCLVVLLVCGFCSSVVGLWFVSLGVLGGCVLGGAVLCCGGWFVAWFMGWLSSLILLLCLFSFSFVALSF